ncbi:hypothetical protein ACFW1M_35090 [Streptomyces inhibens]|uniref:hypothetical protein n=1 Tax=Streptomyces inhibens TaxID=2293571 RepID=UPI00367F066F
MSRAPRPGPYGNVLLGAMPHSADRLRHRQAPANPEQLLLDALGTAVSDAETRERGRVLREQVPAQDRLGMVLQTITSRTVSQGYAMADLRQDLQPRRRRGWRSWQLRRCRPWTRSWWRPGQPEVLAFIEAMGKASFAVTTYARLSVCLSEPLIAIGTTEDIRRPRRVRLPGIGVRAVRADITLGRLIVEAVVSLVIFLQRAGQELVGAVARTQRPLHARMAWS